MKPKLSSWSPGMTSIWPLIIAAWSFRSSGARLGIEDESSTSYMDTAQMASMNTVAPGGGRAEAGVVSAARGRLDVLLQQVEQGHGVGQPVGEAGVVVLLCLNLAAHGVDDAVKQLRLVELEHLPLEAGAEDEQRCHRPSPVEAQILCTHPALIVTSRPCTTALSSSCAQCAHRGLSEVDFYATCGFLATRSDRLLHGLWQLLPMIAIGTVCVVPVQALHLI